ncbi:MAG TPA: hypothetical protein VKQ05_14170 [Gemmatimonadales bacterium]|nr:hypothetical protein [Gemmatimonadales bacterium]
MNELPSSDFRPDPELAAVLRSALEPSTDQATFVARVMAQYDRARERGPVPIPTFDVLASWFRPGVAAALAGAALIAGILFGRTMLNPATPASIETALAPAEGSGLADLVTSPNPPDASVAYTSLVDQR